MPVTKSLLREKAVKAKLRLLKTDPATIWFLAKYYIADLIRSDAFTVVSYPKSGRTWLDRLLVGLACTQQGETPEPDDVYRRLSARHGMPGIRFTHAGSSWESGAMNADEIGVSSPADYADGDFVFLVRDPRDVLVSSYYHMRFRTGIDEVTIEDMVENSLIGLPKLVSFMNLWWGHVKQNQDRAIVVRFEEFKADAASTLGKVCVHAGIQAARGELASAEESARFSKLQANERQNKGKNPWLRAADVNNALSYKMRKGKVGEYREFFTASQQDAINEYIRTHLCSDMGY